MTWSINVSDLPRAAQRCSEHNTLESITFQEDHRQDDTIALDQDIKQLISYNEYYTRAGCPSYLADSL